MKTMYQNRYYRGAHAIAAQLATKDHVRVNISTPAADSYFFRVHFYIEHYFCKLFLHFTSDGYVLVYKRGS